MPLHPEAEFERAKKLYFEQDYSNAAPQLEAIADIFPMAHHFLGVMAQTGLSGQGENNEVAAKHYRKAADGGIGIAAHNLGILYQAGLLSDGGPAEAYEEYSRAYRLDHKPALEKIIEVEAQNPHLSDTGLQPIKYHAKRRSLWDRLAGRR